MGASCKRFMRNLKEMMSLYRPDILVLLETRVSGEVTDSMCKIGKKDWFKVEGDSFSRGIWILWDGNLVDLKITHAHKQFIHVLMAPNTEEEWQLTVTYASPRPATRTEPWSKLEALQVS